EQGELALAQLEAHVGQREARVIRQVPPRHGPHDVVGIDQGAACRVVQQLFALLLGEREYAIHDVTRRRFADTKDPGKPPLGGLAWLEEKPPADREMAELVTVGK